MILNIYKPKNWTSHDVVAKSKRVLNEKKVGHAGTLDPLAEGVLIVLTGEDTKKQSEIMKMLKEYKCKIAFGVASPTYDLEGELTFHDVPHTSEFLERVKHIISSYKGKISQTIPPFSAKKVKGEKMYEIARKMGPEKVSMMKKDVEIFDIEINDLSYQNVVEFVGRDIELPVLDCTVTCGSGTFVRSLAYDMGEELGVGGVLIQLVRSRVGDYKVEDSKTLEFLDQQF